MPETFWVYVTAYVLVAIGGFLFQERNILFGKKDQTTKLAKAKHENDKKKGDKHHHHHSREETKDEEER